MLEVAAIVVVVVCGAEDNAVHSTEDGSLYNRNLGPVICHHFLILALLCFYSSIAFAICSNRILDLFRWIHPAVVSDVTQPAHCHLDSCL